MFWKVIRYSTSTTTTKAIPKASHYIAHFQALQKKLEEQKTLIAELEQQNKLAQRAKVMTISDSIRQIWCKITKSKFQSAALRELRSELIEYRNQLQSKIQQSNVKWEKPRQEIMRIRKEVQEDFLEKFVPLDSCLRDVLDLKIEEQELVEGVALTHRLLLSILQKHGVQFYSPEVGTKFDPELHECIKGEDDTKNGEVITQVKSPGWRIQGRVVKKSSISL